MVLLGAGAGDEMPPRLRLRTRCDGARATVDRGAVARSVVRAQTSSRRDGARSAPCSTRLRCSARGEPVRACPVDSWPARSDRVGGAVPCDTENEVAGVQGERSIARLLAPEPSVTRERVEVSAADGVVKPMPAPPVSRLVEYVRVLLRRPRRANEAPRAAALVHRLESRCGRWLPADAPRSRKARPQREREDRLEGFPRRARSNQAKHRRSA